MKPRFNLSRDKNDTLTCFSYKDDYCFLQFHSQLEICLVDDGEMEMLVDGTLKTLKKGDISVVLSFVPHMYKTPSHSASSIIFIPTHLCEEFMSLTENKRLVSPFISNQKAYETIKEYFYLLQKENVNNIKQLGYIYVILGIILENTVLENTKSPINSELISKILFYINDNYQSDITPSQIAEHFGYSQSHISRYFKACCGVNLVKYIAIIRLRRAVMLMCEGNHNITYCILESGFSSHTAFYRSFKNEFGCSPKEYIKRIRQSG